MSGIGPREAALRAMREARVTKPAPAKPSVTKLSAAVTKVMGRPKVHETGASRQAAYRARKKVRA